MLRQAILQGTPSAISLRVSESGATHYVNQDGLIVWFELIKQCRPDVVFGEQVESAIKYGWLDLVQDDLEREGYSLGAAGIPAAGVGAPHIRHRLYFVAQSSEVGRGGWRDGDTARHSGQVQIEGRGSPSELADDIDARPQGWVRARAPPPPPPPPPAAPRGRPPQEGRQDQHGHAGRNGTTGFWANADWIDCKDGKARPVEPSTFPLAYGAPARVGRLRAYGNAIVPQVAQAFIEAYLET